jgi:hypothetical protein
LGEDGEAYGRWLKNSCGAIEILYFIILTRPFQYRKITCKIISGYLSLFLGGLSLFAIACFLFPELFTTPDLRKSYPIALFRQILFFTLVLSFSLGLLTFILNKRKRMGVIGMLCSTVAILLGGWQVEIKEFDTGLFYIGLDWAILDLLVLALIFIPFEKIFPKREQQIILRPEWQTDLMYFIFGSYYLPGNEWPADYGIQEKLPGGYLRQLLHPFMKQEKKGKATQSTF